MPVATSLWRLERQGSLAPTFELLLEPSIHASWDLNRNGIPDYDNDEDINGDGFITSDDVDPGAMRFRGATAGSPLIGFERGIDPDSGETVVRHLKRDFTYADNARFAIFGNTEDQRTLIQGGTPTLGDDFAPDLLPDFVSPEPDAERLVVHSQGNLVDVAVFSAYNSTAETFVVDDDPAIGWDELKDDIDATYRRYSSFDARAAATSNDLAESDFITRPVSVWVDHEATSPNFHFPLTSDGYLVGTFPDRFYAGILDQWFTEREEPLNSGNVSPLARDGRVAAYSPLFPIVTFTGYTRYGFGIDLSGAVYDAGRGTVPTPRVLDFPVTGVPNPYEPAATWGTDILAANRLDLPPNDDAFLDLAVTRSLPLPEPRVSGNILFKAIGGTSGGLVDLAPEEPMRFQIESKLPGADLPGLHGAYILSDGPYDLLDPRFGTPEDDIRDVAATRTRRPDDDTATGALVEPDIWTGTIQRRRAHLFAEVEDFKLPITTGFRGTWDAIIMTDPEITFADPDSFRIKSGFYAREHERNAADSVDLIATTQSDGSAEVTKFLVDEAVDLVVDIAAATILSSLSQGGYLAACGGGIGKPVRVAAGSLIAGIADKALLGADRGGGWATTVYNGAFAGTSVIPGYNFNGLLDTVKINVSSGNLVLDPWRKLPGGGSDLQLLNVCTAAAAPFRVLKTLIKGTYDERTFGGEGNAQAVGMKILSITIPPEAQLDDGVFNVTSTYTRRLEIRSSEPDAVPLSTLDWSAVFDSYPYPDEVSDHEFIEALLIASEAEDDDRGPATNILRRMAQNRIIREMDREAVEGPLAETELERVQRLQQQSLYQDYRLAFMRMPPSEMYFGPGHQLADTTQPPLGDYELVVGETPVTVSMAGVALASRNNEHANAQAKVSSNGLNVVPVATVIQVPD